MLLWRGLCSGLWGWKSHAPHYASSRSWCRSVSASGRHRFWTCTQAVGYLDPWGMSSRIFSATAHQELPRQKHQSLAIAKMASSPDPAKCQDHGALVPSPVLRKNHTCRAPYLAWVPAQQWVPYKQNLTIQCKHILLEGNKPKEPSAPRRPWKSVCRLWRSFVLYRFIIFRRWLWRLCGDRRGLLHLIILFILLSTSDQAAMSSLPNTHLMFWCQS